MNSYPPELLTQLAPVMFVAGLGQAAPATPATPGTPMTPTTPGARGDPFQTLIARLRDVLSVQRKVAVWQPEQSKSFQVIMVDKDVRFPPRKYAPPEDPGGSYSNAHSPLSPLTPSSPLYPDGLIAPIWIRKHTSLVPSVFVLFLRLPELPPAPTPRSPLDGPDPELERQRTEEERRRDTELAQEIAGRKKATSERNTKLTVVLMASRRLLDDPALDARLTYIRRTSGLDSRAALFVLSPVSAAELGDFVRSLQEALHEPAVEYYTAHSKRVRRKRNRHAQTAASYGPLSPPIASGPARPLRPEGWNVRYEFKMACFAEFRGEYEVALKHYQDAYASLLVMFGSTSILPPRTKRWAEAKVLADCITIKISKLYLYNAEHGLALSNHNQHVRKFCDFSRGWGIGEEAFEYWSWIARQYRVFAELLEQGMRTTLKIPSSGPALSLRDVPTPMTSRTQLPPLEGEVMRVMGVNPGLALQHPGYYYYMAARCTERRRQRFMSALESDAGARATPGFANEGKVDHLTIILELYTRSYELLKKQAATPGQAQGRLTLWIAYRIGRTYYESGKFDMASRFFERIARTYRLEKWDAMLRPLLSTWYKCAQRLGDVELSVRLLLEMMSNGYGDPDDPSALTEDLMAVLKSTVPSTTDGAVVVNLMESESILDSTVAFWGSDVLIGEATPFQICLQLSDTMAFVGRAFASLALHLSGRESDPPIVVHHEDIDTTGPVQYVDVGAVSASGTETFSANLNWEPGASLVIGGSLSGTLPATLEFTKIILTVKEGSWCLELPQVASNKRRGMVTQAQWLQSIDPVKFIDIEHGSSTLTVRNRPYELRVELKHDGPAYIGEKYTITIEVINADSRVVNVVMDVLLHPADADNAVNHIIVDDEQSMGLIKGVHLGTLEAGATTTKLLYLTSTGGAGDRSLDLSFQSTSPNDEPLVNALSPTSDARPGTELLETLVVPTVHPFKMEQRISYKRTSKASRGLLDMETFGNDYWDDSDGGQAVITTSLSCVGPWSTMVESCKLVRKENAYAKVLECFMDRDADTVEGEWLPDDQISDVCVVSIALEDGHDFATTPILGPGDYEITWRRVTASDIAGPMCTTLLSLPSLQPPTDARIALLHVAPTAYLHQPTEMKLVVRNRHPTRTAHMVVSLELDDSPGFILSGVRSGRVPVLLPGAEWELRWTLIPLECGYVRLPQIRVIDRRKPFVAAGDQSAPMGHNPELDLPGDEVRVVDVRWDGRDAEGQESVLQRRNSLDSESSEEERQLPQAGTVLVLP